MHKSAGCSLFLAGAAALNRQLFALPVQKPRQKRQQNHGARNRPDKQVGADRGGRTHHGLEQDLVLRRPGAALALLHQQRPRPLDMRQLLAKAVLLAVVAGHDGDEPDRRPRHLGLEVRGAVGVKKLLLLNHRYRHDGHRRHGHIRLVWKDDVGNSGAGRHQGHDAIIGPGLIGACGRTAYSRDGRPPGRLLSNRYPLRASAIHAATVPTFL